MEDFKRGNVISLAHTCGLEFKSFHNAFQPQRKREARGAVSKKKTLVPVIETMRGKW